jgi:predicted TPR repeat methyltransferase
MTKYARYQDYVIKNGSLVGEFEKMYQDFEDPWEQTVRERDAFEKIVALEIIRREGYKRIVELGCGLGNFTARLHDVAGTCCGIDVSKTAVDKARLKHPGIAFECADILDFDFFRHYKPDCIVMAEISWYVLEKLNPFKSFLSTELRGGGLIHLLMTYRDD